MDVPYVSLFWSHIYLFIGNFHWQNILEINISWCNLISENGVEALARGCNKVKKFSSKGKCLMSLSQVNVWFKNFLFPLIGCKKVNDAALNALAKFCPKIEILNLHSCDVSGIFFFETNYRSINQSHLFLDNNWCVDSKYLNALS